MILITRPAPEGETLCQLLNKQGFETFWLPTLQFAPPPDPENAKQALSQPNHYHWLIFISPQAVRYGLPLLPPAHTLSCRIAAIGKGTAHLLTQNSYPVTTCPHSDRASDALLALPDFNDVANQRIALIKGRGGRKHLSHILTARGALVTDIPVYQRIRPTPPNLLTCQTLIQEKKITALVTTSGEGLLNLFKLLEKKTHSLLLRVPLVVISPRLARLGKRLQFRRILLASGPGGNAIMSALKTQPMSGKSG